MAALFTAVSGPGVRAASEKLLTGPTATAMLDQLTGLGMKGLGFGLGGMRHLISRDAVASSGRSGRAEVPRINALRSAAGFLTKLMNVAPTPVPLPGLFDALANGQVDGADIDLELAWRAQAFRPGA